MSDVDKINAERRRKGLRPLTHTEAARAYDAGLDLTTFAVGLAMGSALDSGFSGGDAGGGFSGGGGDAGGGGASGSW